MLPGLRLRQARERLGLTYRDVERASYELAAASRASRLHFCTSAVWRTSKTAAWCQDCTNCIRWRSIYG